MISRARAIVASGTVLGQQRDPVKPLPLGSKEMAGGYYVIRGDDIVSQVVPDDWSEIGTVL